ncbi:glycosyltransferase family 4 protein [Flavobacterium artemisiae]|uniref:Glycosyltransferase family 4 protein n=1 Tax=Flavobacterium artemisiae TaxID=2126556 RepID=A0ABW4H888_9FLAO
MIKKNILHIVAVSFSINYFFGNQFVYLKKNGNKYHLGCSPSQDFNKLSKELDFIPFEVEISREITPLKDIRAILQTYKYIKRNKIDKVVGHTPKGGMIAMIASFLAGVSERIYFRHGLVYETSSGFKRVLLKNIERLTGVLATRVVCVSNGIKEISEKDKLNNFKKNLVLGLGTCSGIDIENKYNPNSYDLQNIKELKRKLNIKDDDFVVGFVGRLVKDKGIDELILAWDILKENHKNIKLLLIGPIEERDAISDYSKAKILNEPSIRFTDFILDASIYYCLMDVFILPSYREGFPTVALEASAMSVPVLISKATGCTEAIIENKTGFFITHDPIDIASKITYYMQNEEICVSHGNNGRSFVVENFEQTKVWDLIDKVLKI